MTSITETAAIPVPDGVPPLSGMTDDELMVLARACVAEQRRRDVTKNAEQQVEAIRVAYRAAVEDATDEAGPHEWTRPTGAHDAYPQGWQVTYGGQVWRSMIPGNAHRPGTSGWRIVPTDGEVAPYVQPTGAHDAYHKGDMVTHEGKTWTCGDDVCAHAPGVAGWEEVTAPEPEEPPTDEPVDPPKEPIEPEPETEEPPAEEEPAPWQEGQVYAVDDLATWEDATYRCRQAHTAIAGWTPSAVPALWELVA